MNIQKSNFRYDINALRAIAVAGVVLFHYRLPFFDGGFSGVDIFYVISGYLMTRIVFTELSKNVFSFRGFYSKRVQRIVPALSVLIACVLFAGFFIYLPVDYHLVAKNSAASLLFVSNILYGLNSNYFDASSDTNPLLHTWSLSVEWQFYLLLPLLIFFLHKVFKNDKRKHLIFFILIAFAGFFLAVWFTKIRPTASFYLLPTRSWEMLAGGIAFFAEGTIGRRVKYYLACIGYLGLASGIIFLDSYRAWPGYFTLIPVLSTFIIIIANNNEYAILKNSVIQFIGKTSYSMYLWHWPVYVFSTYLGIQHSILNSSLLIMLSLSFAFLSYRYVESISFNGSRKAWVPALALGAVSFVFLFTDVNTIVFDKKSISIANYANSHLKETATQFGTGSCFISKSGRGLSDLDTGKCLTLKNGVKNYVLVGDSHAAQYSLALRRGLAEMNVQLNVAAVSGCLPVLKKNGKTISREIIDYIYLDYLPRNIQKIDGVIISANWVSSNEDPSTLLKDIRETINYLEKMHLKVILIGQNEAYNISFTSIAAREHEYGANIRNNYLDDEAYQLNVFLRKNLGDYYVDVYGLNTFQKVSSESTPYMLDQNHYTQYGAELVTREIMLDKRLITFLK